MNEPIAIALLVLAVAACAAVTIWAVPIIIRAVRVARARRRACAAVYDERPEDTEPTVPVQLELRVRSPSPPGLRLRGIPPAPVVPVIGNRAVLRERRDEQGGAGGTSVGHTYPPGIAPGIGIGDEPTSPSLFLDEPSPAAASDDGFKGAGGEFGGAGASGGWDGGSGSDTDTGGSSDTGGNEAA